MAMLDNVFYEADKMLHFSIINAITFITFLLWQFFLILNRINKFMDLRI